MPGMGHREANAAISNAMGRWAPPLQIKSTGLRVHEFHPAQSE